MPIYSPVSSGSSTADVRSPVFLSPSVTSAYFSDYDTETHVVFQSDSKCRVRLPDTPTPGDCLYFRNDGEGDVFIVPGNYSTVLSVNGVVPPYGKEICWKKPSAYGGVLCEAYFDGNPGSIFFYLMGEFDLVDPFPGG